MAEYAPNGNRYSDEYKKEVVEEYWRRKAAVKNDPNYDNKAKPATLTAISKEYGIAFTTLRFWIQDQDPDPEVREKYKAARKRLPYKMTQEQKTRARAKRKTYYDEVAVRFPKDGTKQRLCEIAVEKGLSLNELCVDAICDYYNLERTSRYTK